MSGQSQDTRVTNVEAETVIVSPVQQTFGATGDEVRGWTEALWQGPLERSGQVKRAKAGEEAAAEGRHLDAATEFLAVAAALDDRDYGPAAESYRQRAAGALADGGERSKAFDIYMGLARGTLGDGEMTAIFHARRALELAPAELAWSAEGMRARANWPEQEEGDVAALRRAWEETRGGPEEPEWAAALVELLLLNGEDDVCLAVAGDVAERLPLVPGPRLELELDRLELEAKAGGDEAEPGWARLLEWARDPQLPLAATATVLQRRGVVLARRGEPERARSAFLQAAGIWGRDPHYDDQTAEAFFSAGSALLALGDISPAFDDASHLARRLRGSVETATSRTERLERRGLRMLVDGKLPDALRFLAGAFNLARRAGNLNDFLKVTEELGDVLARSDRPEHALEAYVQAGHAPKAATAAGSMSVDDVLGVVSLQGPRWERAAAWAAVAAAGRIASDEAAATVAAAALAELDRESPSGFPPNPSYHAGQALANLVCAVPEDLLGLSLEALRTRLELGGGDPRRLAEPFILVTGSGRSDQTEIVIDAVLHPYLQTTLPPGLLEDQLAARPDQRQRLLAAARSGDGQALDFVTFADWLEEDEELVQRACEQVQAASRSKPREVSEENGTTTVSYGIGLSLAPVGLMARSCPEPVRRQLVASLLEVLGEPDPDLPIMTRVAAVEGIHNLSPALPGDQVPAVVEALAARAVRDDEPSEFDRIGTDDPLSRFNLNFAPPDVLRASSLEALGGVVKDHGAGAGELAAAIGGALQSGVDRLLVAALIALRAVPKLKGPEPDTRDLLAHSSESVRLAALELLVARDPAAAAVAAARLAEDPSPRLRTRLVGIASDMADGKALLEKLSRDRDSYTRAMAKLRLGS
jgi:hypothetical protein